jgi:TolB-like protein
VLVPLAAVTFGAVACGGAPRTAGQAPSPTSDSLATAIAAERARSSEGEVRTVAVPPFRPAAGDTLLGPIAHAIADFLATDLSRSPRLKLVERARLGEVLRELALVEGGRVDSATAPRLGRVLAARELLLGSLDTLPGGDLRLTVRIADVATGVLRDAIDARAPLREILAAEKSLAFRLFDALGVSLSPAERARVEERPTQNGVALLAYGRGVQAELAGDPAAAAREYLRASRVDPGFRLAGERLALLSARLGVTASSLVPELRGLDAPVTGVVDRLNRPLDLITTQSRPVQGPGDPAFPTTLVTVVIVIQRP